MAFGDVFPRRNLPDAAEDWGRAVESAARTNGYDIQRLKSSAASGNRGSAGQLGVISRQIQGVADLTLEAESRSIHFIDLGTYSTPVVLPADFQQVTVDAPALVVNAPPPADGKQRTATVLLSGNGYNSDTSPELSAGNVKLMLNDQVSDWVSAPEFTSVPPNFFETLDLVVQVPAGNSFTVNMRVSGANNSPASKTVRLGVTNMQAVVVYGERVL